MKNHEFLPVPQERANTWTHLSGAVFALASIWMIWPSARLGWQMALGVAFFVAGMFLMFLSSTLYHWAPKGRVKQALRKCDHISIYVMIACSYSPICIGVVGGKVGWIAFAVQWILVLSGTVYKLIALGHLVDEYAHHKVYEYCALACVYAATQYAHGSYGAYIHAFLACNILLQRLFVCRIT